jgi:hypothetical protein
LAIGGLGRLQFAPFPIAPCFCAQADDGWWRLLLKALVLRASAAEPALPRAAAGSPAAD